MSASTMLSPVLDLTEAAPLAATLLAQRGAPLVLDGSAVERLGGQCLQVLLAARATWLADGLEFRLLAASPALAESLAVLGAGALLPVWTEECAA